MKRSICNNIFNTWPVLRVGKNSDQYIYSLYLASNKSYITTAQFWFQYAITKNNNRIAWRKIYLHVEFDNWAHINVSTYRHHQETFERESHFADM